MPEQLSTTQLRRAIHAVGVLAEVDDLSDYPEAATRALRCLMPCGHCGYNAIDLDSGQAIVVADPPGTVFHGGPEALAELGHQNPLIVRALAGDRSVLRLSDHITRRELHRTQLYQDVYRRIALEYQLGVQLPPIGHSLGRSGEFVGLSLARERCDFTAEERLLLGLVQPHFAGTLQRLHELALAQAIRSGLAHDDAGWLLLVTADDIVAWASEGADEALGACVGELLHLAGRSVTVRRVPDAYPGLDALHIALRQRPSREALRELGLSKRQAEVWDLASRGLTAQGIADELCLSRRTVEKHLEAIYARLGVRSRVQGILATMPADRA